jgi:transcriptional regulator with PAS, ATPase and Fis domain
LLKDKQRLPKPGLPGKNCGKTKIVFTLVVESGTRPIVFLLTPDLNEMIAGSLPDNSIYLPFKGISRQHFSVFRKNQHWYIRDLGSTNGTLVNGKKITEVQIRPGDVIQAGTLSIHVEVSEEEFESFETVMQEEKIPESIRTDRVGYIPLDKTAPVYSFPMLVFPEDTVVCRSRAMLEIYQKIHSICRSSVNVLLVGETGTGKEMMARMLHLSGPRPNGPFIAINCAAIPDHLAEAELFGIGEKVATDVSQRKGKIMLAHGGTLFLDELSAFPYELQAKILRAVQEKSVTPLGESRSFPVDFRLISATNEDPHDLIRGQKLREDLYHRLATVEIALPPLRERREDLEVLVPVLLKQIAQNEGKHLSGISKRLMALLLHYDYPGNIRELVNILRSMIALAHPGEILDIHLIPEKILNPKKDFSSKSLPGGTEPYDLRQAVQDITKDMIVQALDLYNGNVKKAASHLKVTTFG